MVLLSVIGLILFAQVCTDSAWVLCSPFLVWLGIGFVEGEESRKKTLNGAADGIAGIALPLTLVLIAYGINTGVISQPWQQQPIDLSESR